MPIVAVHSDNAPLPIGPYAQGIKANGFLFAAGQIALDPQTGELVSGGLEPQTHRVMKSITAVLRGADSSWDQAVKTTIYLTDMANFTIVNGIYEEYLGGAKPARTTVAVTGLPKGALIEVDVVALA